jgi:hypothetical protein
MHLSIYTCSKSPPMASSMCAAVPGSAPVSAQNSATYFIIVFFYLFILYIIDCVWCVSVLSFF